MFASIWILVFAATANVVLSGDFCENGEITILKCPDDSIVTGIQTTSELFSADATPVCSKLADEILSYDASPNYFRRDDDLDSLQSTFPKVACQDSDYAVQSLSICSVDGEITETSGVCSHLKYVERNNATYMVVGEPGSPELKCEEGSVLHGIWYDRDNDGNLIAMANCTAMDTNGEKVSVLDKRDNCTNGRIVEAACPDGYVISGFETAGNIFTPDVIPVCAKINDKVNPKLRASSHEYYFRPDIEWMSPDCNFGYPVFTKFSMCFVNGVVTSTAIECRHFQGNLKVVDLEDVEVTSGDSMLRCAEGSFVQGFSMKRHLTAEKYAVFCVVIVR